MFKHLVVAAACAGLIACGGTQSSPEAEPSEQATMDGRKVVSVGEMLASSPDGKVTVDMRNSNLGFRVEKGLDFSAITIICPSSRVMNLAKWIPEVAHSNGQAPSDYKKGFTMFPFMAPAAGSVTEQSAPVCIDSNGYNCGSEREPDGSWTCLC